MNARRPTPRMLGRLTVAFSLLLALALVAGLGAYLASTQAAAEDKLRLEFLRRAKVTADLSGGVMTASDAKTRAFAEAYYAGPASGMASAITKGHEGLDSILVFRTDGTLLGADPPRSVADARPMASNRGFALTVDTDKLTFSDVVGDPKDLRLLGFQSFSSPEGPRVLVISFPLAEVSGILSPMLSVSGDRSYIVDGRGNVIISSAGAPPGKPMPDQALARASSVAGRGLFNGDYYVSLPVPGTNWRAVFAVPEQTLVAPVQSTRRVAWLLFAAFAGAILLLLLIGASSLIGAARLAHARLHDGLTGLPSRSLFLDQAEMAIAVHRPQDGPLAVLFIDLDGFKPINDTHGHAVGDAVLKIVSARLLESMRPGDGVSRFGGDEFLVLCKGLRHESDAHAVAERIQKYIAEPIDINGSTVFVGTSIGIALVDDHAADAETLIHNADLAMYQVKQNGKGGIRQYSPDLAATA